MKVRVEFYGIPRQRAGVATATAEGTTLGEVLADLAARYPALADDCLDGGLLRRPFTANLNGDRFVTDPATELAPTDCLLILGADAGG